MIHPDKVAEDDLHAYVDGQLTPSRRAEVEAYLAENPSEAAKILAYRKLNEILRTRHEPVLNETVPGRLRWPRPSRRRGFRIGAQIAAAVTWLLLGGVAGWLIHPPQEDSRQAITRMAHNAAIAHVVYTPEVRHPVEVTADQQQHLVQWLSKRLGTPIQAPNLSGQHYELLGGRLLPAEDGMAAQFMYQNTQGARLTLYVRANIQDNTETAFRFIQEGKVSVFYWVDGPLGYALSGELEKETLLKIATAVYQSVSP